MIIKSESYNLKLSEDETLLYSAGKDVRAYDINLTIPAEVMRIKDIHEPFWMDLSSDGKHISVSNTSGEIFICDTDSGNIRIKNKCLSEELVGIYYVDNDKGVLSCTFDGRIFILDVEHNKCEIIESLHATVPKICPTHDPNFYLILYSDNSSGFSYIYKIDISKTKADLIAEDKLRTIIDNSPTSNGCKVYFFSYNHQENIHELMCFNVETNKNICLANVDKLFKVNKIHCDIDSFDFLRISNNGNCFALYGMDNLLLFDIQEKKLIANLSYDCISDVHFCCEDTKIIVGTWNDIQIIEFDRIIN